MRIPCLACGKEEPKSCSKKNCPYFIGHPKTFKKDFSGTSPNLFVGKYGYPHVNVGILNTEEYAGHDDPKLWTAKQTPIKDILQLRGSLINSQFLADVKKPVGNKFLEVAQLVAQGKQPTDMEISLNKQPSYSVEYPQGTKPHGATAKLLRAKLTENVRVPKIVDKIVNDEIKANEALQILKKRLDEYQMTKLFTAGLLGEQKKLVPTRWGITAVDDTLGKQHLEQIRTNPLINEPTTFFGGHFGNYFVIILLPKTWRYELFEFLTGNRTGKGCTDYEGYNGRTRYAEDTAGGYYAARLGITQWLVQHKKQAAVLALRFITDEYSNPLGVWVVREAVKKALETKPLKFANEQLALSYAKARATKFGIHYNHQIKQRSKFLASLKQKTLADF